MCSLTYVVGYAVHQKGYRCYDPSTKRTNVTIEFTFSKIDTFFPPTTNFSLQEETRNEELNWLHFNWLNKETTIEQEKELTHVNMEIATAPGKELTQTEIKSGSGKFIKAGLEAELEFHFFGICKPISGEYPRGKHL